MAQDDPLETIDFTQVDTFEGFKMLASRDDLTNIEKIGFPNSYREHSEKAIFNDIAEKLLLFKKPNQLVLDIGSGCSGLPSLLVSAGEEFSHKITLLDSEEMHANLNPEVLMKSTQISAKFPECQDFISAHLKSFDAIICYSVFQYSFMESTSKNFLDAAVSLLSPGGRLLIGDIPNISMKNRFLKSDEGLQFSKRRGTLAGQPTSQRGNSQALNDSVVMKILSGARKNGLHSFVLPQNSNLPMSNRREDILIVRP